MRSATRKKTGKDRAYLTWIHTLPCAVTGGRHPQGKCSPGITAHHAGPHGSSVKAPDRMAIPLCFRHHDWSGAESVHRIGKKFWERHGLDLDALVADLNAKYDSGALEVTHAPLY